MFDSCLNIHPLASGRNVVSRTGPGIRDQNRLRGIRSGIAILSIRGVKIKTALGPFSGPKRTGKARKKGCEFGPNGERQGVEVRQMKRGRRDACPLMMLAGGGFSCGPLAQLITLRARTGFRRRYPPPRRRSRPVRFPGPGTGPTGQRRCFRLLYRQTSRSRPGSRRLQPR